MNKETLQNYNTKLNTNNTSLNDILETINGMSEMKLGEKTITANGIYNATDDDLDGYSSVDVQTSGADLTEYFTTNLNTTFNSSKNILSVMVKKLPNISIASNVTNYSYMFYRCGVLEEIPPLNTSNVTNMRNMFSECTSLKTIPLLDTSQVTDMSSMFYKDSALEEIPLLDTSQVTNMDNMFNSCTSLEEIPLLNTSKVTSMTQIFSGCSKLKTLPEIDTSNVTNLSTAFQSCSYLTDVPLLDCSKVNKISYAFNACGQIRNLGGLKNIGQAFLTTQSANYYDYTITFSSSYLTHDSLMNIINNLYDIASAGIKTQKLVLGYSSLNKLTEEEKAIATNKGWTLS